MLPRPSRRASRAGFTLIELLIVVVIIGILAAVAIPKFSTSKGKTYVASMKSDLRNLAAAQESYSYDYGVYTDDMGALSFTNSPGVSIAVSLGVDGWAAEATHPAASPLRCQLYFGSSGPMSIATEEGKVACD